MTHKDYKLIAGALAEANVDRQTVEIVADALRGTNPAYNRDRFIAAASGTPINGRDKVRGVHA